MGAYVEWFEEEDDAPASGGGEGQRSHRRRAAWLLHDAPDEVHAVGAPGRHVLAYLGTRILSRSPVVHVDGLLSVAAAFTMSEALELARRARWEGATVRWRWPFRFLLSGGRP